MLTGSTALIAENAALRKALKLLVMAKDEKERNGGTDLYHELKKDAWNIARDTLAQYPGS